MGIFNINCSGCNESFMWFSGNITNQLCEICNKKEDASVNSLGSIPSGRLVRKKQTRVKRPVKENEMSLAKKFLGLLFEDDMPTAEPMDDMPAGDNPPEGANAELHDEPAPLEACMNELDKCVSEMEDGEIKERLAKCIGDLKALMAPPAAPAEEEPAIEPEA